MGLLSALASISDKILAVIVTDGTNTLGTSTHPFYVNQTPVGAAGGDLTGTYPNPTVATGKIDGTKIKSTVFQRFLVVTAKDASGSAQADTATGAKVGDIVQSVIDLTDLTDVHADFEATITVADQIQQSAGSLNTKKCLVILLAQS